MLHTILIKLIHLGWIALPYPLYSLYNGNYLQLKQMLLLIIQTIILLSLMFPGWLMQLIRLITNSLFVLIILDLCIIQYQLFTTRYQIKICNDIRRQKKYQLIHNQPIFFIQYFHTLKKFKFKETSVLIIVLILWLLLKIKTTKVTEFGINALLEDNTVFYGFLITLDGWNCNYPEFTVISGICLLVLIFCFWFTCSILKFSKLDCTISEQQRQDMNSYKIYLLQYLIIPSLLVFIIDFTYNIIAHLSCDGLLQCYKYFKYGIFFHVIIDWGIIFSIGLFFYKKTGRFSLQMEQENSVKSTDGMEDHLDTPLNKN